MRRAERTERAGRAEGAERVRPRFIGNLAVSVDGKIDSSAREGAGFGSAEDRKRLFALRAETDALVVGAGTIRSEDPSFAPEGSGIAPTRRAAGRPQGLRVAVLSRSGAIDPAGRWLREPAATRILAVPEDLPPERLASLRPVVRRGDLELIRAGRGDVSLETLAARLAELGCETAVVEGGGEVIAAFLEARLLDELRLTVVPLALGGRDAPSAVAGAGWSLASAPRLSLSHSERVGDELFLRYAVRS